MTFTMKDNYRDEISVSEGVFAAPGERVYLTVSDLGTRATASLTPKKARKLAKALKRAAKEATR